MYYMESELELEKVGDPYRVMLKDGKIILSETVKLGAHLNEGDEMRVKVDLHGKITMEKKYGDDFNDYSDDELDNLKDDIWTEQIIRANKDLDREI